MRIGKLGAYPNNNAVPLPDDASYDTIFRLVGADTVYGKKVDGSIYVVGAVGATPITVGKTLFVDDIFGNDATALPQRQDLPYKTILAAQAVANAGETIVIRAGVYFELAPLGKDQVRYNFEQGAILSSSICFADLGSTIDFEVVGYGQFFATFTVLQVLADGIININGFSAEVAGPYVIRNTANGEISFNMINEIKQIGLEQVVRTDGAAVISISAETIIGTGGIVQMSDGEVTLRATNIVYNANSRGYVAFNLNFGLLNVYGNVQFNGTGLYGTPAIWNDGDAISNFYGKVTSAMPTDPTLWSTIGGGSGSKVTFHDTVETLTLLLTNGGYVNYKGQVINNYPTFAAINHSSGKTVVENLILNQDTSNTADGIELNGAGLVLAPGASIVTNNVNVYSINAANPQTIKTYPRAVATKAAHVNVTELISALLVDVNADSLN